MIRTTITAPQADSFIQIAAQLPWTDFDSLLSRVAWQANKIVPPTYSLEYFIRECFNRNNIEPVQKERAFHWVLRNQKWDLAHLILQKDTQWLDPNLADCAIFEAARAGSKVIVNDVIVARKGDISPNHSGGGLLDAARNGHEKIVSILLSLNPKPSREFVVAALLASAENGHADCLRPIVESRTDFDPLELGVALRRAASKGHLDCVTFLAEQSLPLDQMALAFIDTAEDGHPACLRALWLSRKWPVQFELPYSRGGRRVRLLEYAKQGASRYNLSPKHGHGECVRMIQEWIDKTQPRTCGSCIMS